MKHLLFDPVGADPATQAAIRRQQAEPLNAMAYAVACCRAAGMDEDRITDLFEWCVYVGGDDVRSGEVSDEGRERRLSPGEMAAGLVS